MKRIKLIISGVFLLLGTIAPIYAQHDKQEQSKEQGKEQAKPQPAQRQSQQQTQHQPQEQRQQPTQRQSQQQTQHQPQEQRQQPASQPAPQKSRSQQTYGGAYHGGVQPNAPAYGGVHPSGVPQHEKQVRSGFTQSRAGSWEKDHQTWGQRGGYNGYRVPEARFRLYFGSEHHFRIYGLPLVFVGGYPRFQYDGYWVTFVDPWPESWPETWYQNDDVYVDYTDDGYYIYNRSRPGPRIAVTIAF